MLPSTFTKQTYCVLALSYLISVYRITSSYALYHRYSIHTLGECVSAYPPSISCFSCSPWFLLRQRHRDEWSRVLRRIRQNLLGGGGGSYCSLIYQECGKVSLAALHVCKAQRKTRTVHCPQLLPFGHPKPQTLKQLVFPFWGIYGYLLLRKNVGHPGTLCSKKTSNQAPSQSPPLLSN